MDLRTTTSIVTFSRPFLLSGYEDQLPAGDYELVVEEELLQGLSFEAYRRTASYLLVRGKAGTSSVSEMRSVSLRDLEDALSRDREQ